MNELARKLDRWLGIYFDAVIRYRWAVLIVSVLLAFAAASGARLLKFKDDYKVWFNPDNPHMLAFEALQNTYTKIDNILFVVAPRSGEVFEPATLAAVKDLTARAWELPFSIRVDSVTNYQHTRAAADDLVVEDLVEEPAGLDAAALASKRATALDEPLLRDRLVNDIASVTAVNVTFQLPLKDLGEIPSAVAAARRLAADIEAAHPAVDLRLTGTVMLNNAFTEASIHDMSVLVPLMYLAIFIATAIMLRSLAGTLIVTGIIVLSIMTGMGAAGWAGIFITPPVASAPTIIMTLAVADAIHIFVTLFALMRQGMARIPALRESLRLNFQPVFLTSVTTSIGFLTMNASEAPPFRDFGNVVAIGVMAAWLFSITFIPALAAIVPFKAPRAVRGMNFGMDALGDWIVRHGRTLLLGGLLACGVALAFVPRNELDDQFVDYFDHGIEFRRDTDFASENLTGIYQIMYSLPARESGGVSNPDYLAAVEEFSVWLRAEPEVQHVGTITDMFKRLNRNMHGDDPAWHRLPQDRELAAQYLLLYEMSLPFGLDLNNQINIDKSATMVAVTLDNISSAELRAFTARAENWLAVNHPEMHTYGVSPAVMFAHVSERNIRSMLGGTVIGLFIISLLLVFAFRDWRLGAISLVPNLLPAALAFGVWGAAVGQINLAVSVVTGMTFGIVVDGTVHFLSKYLRARREQGVSAGDGIRYAFHHVGAALVANTVILVAGFMMLTLSSFAVNSSMAWLTSLTIVLALLADFLLLPPLLLRLDGRREFARPETPASRDATAFDT